MSDEPNRSAAVRRYVFYSEQRPSRAWMPTLEAINHRFCQLLGAALEPALGPGVAVTPPIAIQLVKHSELIGKLTPPVYLTLVGLKPLRGTVLVCVDAPLISWIVECRFGGDGRFPVQTGNREFSVIEQKCARRQAQTVIEQLAVAWQPIAALEPAMIRHETAAQSISIAHPGEQIIVSVFELRIGRGGGKLTLCVPYAMLEPLHDRLVGEVDEHTADPDPHWQETLRAGLGQAALQLRVELSTLHITLGNLLDLRPGAIFEIDRPETVAVEADGVPLFRGRWGRHGRKLGVMIDEPLPSLLGMRAAMIREAPEERGNDQE
jgi:flagellar motor switch protein FliM